ncbi:hypothetical protein CAEBREN_18029 [Caenorhabditis brenneri]|uniref:Envelope glycoprotein D n=1 Tax=Caenorhabditis brenneri TaxID=135651 RepID=G0M7H2_CAEBE|nr:hypothetical protein CAEBREN_18029 [Caenorhabditis brenneri]
MKTWVFCVLLAPFVVSQVHFLDAEPSKITYEFLEDSKIECKNYTIAPVLTPAYNMKRVFFLACRICVPLVPYNRNKRFLKGIPGLRWIFGDDETTDAPIEPMTEREMYRRANILLKAIMVDSTNISLEEFKMLTNFNGTDLIWHYHYPEHHEADAWAGMIRKRVRCDMEDNLVVSVCGRVNPGRQFSKLKYAVPLASFDPSASFIKVPEINRFSAQVYGVPFSIEHCRKLVTYSECTMKKVPSCNLRTYPDCNVTMKRAPNSTFIRRYGEYSVVVANVEKYTTMINGTVSEHYMDVSKHVVLRLPNTSYAQFGPVKVYGHATSNFTHYSIINNVNNKPFSHEDLDELEDKHGDIPELRKSRSLLPKRKITFIDSYLAYSIIAVFFVIVVIVVCCACCICRKKRNIQEPVQRERRVRFSNDECEIIA